MSIFFNARGGVHTALQQTGSFVFIRSAALFAIPFHIFDDVDAVIMTGMELELGGYVTATRMMTNHGTISRRLAIMPGCIMASHLWSKRFFLFIACMELAFVGMFYCRTSRLSDFLYCLFHCYPVGLLVGGCLSMYIITP
jgi:hypothetical protein